MCRSIAGIRLSVWICSCAKQDCNDLIGATGTCVVQCRPAFCIRDFQGRTAPDATSLPSGENATDQTEPELPSSVCRAPPVPASQSLTVWSSESDATSLPSGENAAEQTE